jgi:hypothetical protein
VKASKLFENMVDFGVSILEFMEVQNIQHFIKHWRLELWEMVFFHEFKQKGGILKRKTWEPSVSIFQLS